MSAFFAILIKLAIGSPAAGITGVLGIFLAILRGAYGTTKSVAGSLSLADVPHILSAMVGVFLGTLAFAGDVFGVAAGASSYATLALAAIASALTGTAATLHKWLDAGRPAAPKAATFLLPGDPNRTS